MGGRARTTDARLTSRIAIISHGQVGMTSVADTPPHPPFLHLPLDTDPIWGLPPDHELQTAAHELKLTGRIQSPAAKQKSGRVREVIDTLFLQKLILVIGPLFWDIRVSSLTVCFLMDVSILLQGCSIYNAFTVYKFITESVSTTIGGVCGCTQWS